MLLIKRENIAALSDLRHFALHCCTDFVAKEEGQYEPSAQATSSAAISSRHRVHHSGHVPNHSSNSEAKESLGCVGNP